MRKKILAKRYADAFVGYASQTKELPDILVELKRLKMLMGDNPGFQDLLKSRALSYVEKSGFIDAALENSFSAELRHFLKLLLKKNRIYITSAIVDYARIRYSKEQAVSALLMSAYPLDAEVIRDIKDSLEKKLNRKLRLYLGVDGDLLSGIQVVVGNTIIDGSIRRSLTDLKERLLALKVNEYTTYGTAAFAGIPKGRPSAR